MDSFYSFWDKINGSPPATGYELKTHEYGAGGHELKPLTPGDMATYAAEDVEDWLVKYGKNTTKLGPEMTDDEFRKHHGQV